MSRDGGLFQLMLNDKFSSFFQEPVSLVKRQSLVGSLKNVLPRLENNALPGNFKQVNCAGSSTEPSVNAQPRKIGVKK